MSSDPRNIWALNAYSFKTVKPQAVFKFAAHVSRDIPYISLNNFRKEGVSQVTPKLLKLLGVDMQ